MKTFTLYSRRGCHLCDEMHRALEALRTSDNFRVRVVDIDREDRLILSYGDRVPVLVNSEGQEICAARFDKAVFMRGLE